MTFKKSSRCRCRQAQAIIEYIVTFVVIAAGILAVFVAFSPEETNLRAIFNNAVDDAITEIEK